MARISLRWRTREAPPDPDGRFHHGQRTLADLVAPAVFEVSRDHVRVDYQYARTLAVTGYPRSVSPGWLDPLIHFEAPIEVALHVDPLDSADVARSLSHKLVQLQSSRLVAARAGRLADPEREVAFEDAERLRDQLQRGEERAFSVGLYVLLRAPSLATLADLTRRVERCLDGMLAHSRVAFLEQDAGFRTCLPGGQDELLVARNLDTSSLATTFPFTSATLSMERGVLLGVATRSQTPVIVDPFDPGLENANLVVFAKSGAGKSYFVKLLALRTLLAGVDCLVIDPEDEYRALCRTVGGQHVRLAAASGGAHLNPFDLPAVAEDEGADVLAERVAGLLGILELMLAEPARPLGGPERAALDRALYRTYAAAGITADPATHGRPAPLLRDLHATLEGAEDELERSLARRLERFVDGSLAAGLFAGPTNVALDSRCVVFNVQALERELRPLAIHVVAAFVWNRVRASRRPRLLVSEESWSVLQYPEGGAFLAEMARRARKHYLGLVTVSQDVADFLGAEHGRTVLTNAALKLLLKQDSTTIEPVAEAFRLSPSDRQLLLAAGKGEGLLYAGGARVALRVEASQAEHALITTAPRELAAREAATDLHAPGRPATNGRAA